MIGIFFLLLCWVSMHCSVSAMYCSAVSVHCSVSALQCQCIAVSVQCTASAVSAQCSAVQCCVSEVQIIKVLVHCQRSAVSVKCSFSVMQCSYSEGQSAVVTEIKLMLATALSLGIRKFLIEEDRLRRCERYFNSKFGPPTKVVLIQKIIIVGLSTITHLATKLDKLVCLSLASLVMISIMINLSHPKMIP